MLARVPRDRHGPMKKTSRILKTWQDPHLLIRTRLVSSPPMLREEMNFKAPHRMPLLSIGGAERRGAPSRSFRQRDVFFLGQCSLFE